MAKRQKETQVLKRREYTDQELDALQQEVGGDLSHESRVNWLLKHRAIKIRKYGPTNEMVVLQALDGSFPYVELDNKWDALTTRENKKAEYNKSYKQFMNSPMDSLPKDLFNI